MQRPPPLLVDERGGRMGQEEDLKQAVGLADACELLSYAFAYPDERLAQALVDGALADDAQACLSDAGVAANGANVKANAEAAPEGLRAWQGASVEETLSVMRKTYSRLYLAPGGHTPIFPYESAFLHVERGLPGIPALFRTSVTLDVERHMREAGVAAKNGRKEPCDSVFEEFEFLSYLHAKRAEALHCNDGERAAAWARRIGAFEEEHVSMWLPTFMRRTQELAEGTPYAAFAALGLATMGERS